MLVHGELSRVIIMLYRLKLSTIKPRSDTFIHEVCNLILGREHQVGLYLFTQLSYMLQTDCLILNLASTPAELLVEIEKYSHSSSNGIFDESLTEVEEGFIACKRCKSKIPCYEF